MEVRAITLVSCGAAALVGCSMVASFDGLLGPTGDATEGPGGGDASSMLDGASNVSNLGKDGAPNGGTDAGGSDAGGTLTDGGVDSAIIRGPAFCVGNVTGSLFCDDFDQSSMLDPSRWQSPTTQGSGSLGITSKMPVSGANVLEADVPSHFNGDDFHAVYTQDIAIPGPTVRVELAFYLTLDLAKTGSSATGEVFEIDSDNGGAVGLYFKLNELFVDMSAYDGDGGSIGNSFDIGTMPPLDAWHTVRLDVTFGANNGVKIQLDGTDVGATTGQRLVTGSVSQVNLGVGVDSNGKMGDLSELVDNVRISTLATPIP